MKRSLVCCLIIASVIMSLAAMARAGVPKLINYQGRLTDDKGNPLDTTVNITFVIFKDPGGTEEVWHEMQEDVVVTNGLFDVLLGSSNPIEPHVFDGTHRWLGMELDHSTMMTPLTPLVSVAYAHRACFADTAKYAQGGPAAGGWIDNGTTVTLVDSTDSVGIGTSDPEFPLDVHSSTIAIHGQTNGSGLASGVYGHSPGAGNGVLAASGDGNGLMATSASGRAVYGLSTSGYGGYFDAPENYFSGQVGIGTESPEYMLHIRNEETFEPAFLEIETSHPTMWSFSGLRIKTPDNRWILYMDSFNHDYLPSGALGLRTWNNGYEIMTWTEDGPVGIGITNPDQLLHVGGNARVDDTLYVETSIGIGTESPEEKLHIEGGGPNAFLKIEQTGPHAWEEAGLCIETPSNEWHLRMGDAFGNSLIPWDALGLHSQSHGEVMVWQANGTVGIGTAWPWERCLMHVAGNARVDDTLFVGTLAVDSYTTMAGNVGDKPGVAASLQQTGGTTLPLEPDYATIVSQEISVPGPGYVIVIADAIFEIEHGYGTADCISYGLSESPDFFQTAYSNRLELGSYIGSDFYGLPTSSQGVFKVAAAGTHNYFLLATKYGGLNIEACQGKLTLLYVPTAYGDIDFLSTSAASGRPMPRISDRKEYDAQDSEMAAVDRDVRAELDELRTEVEELKRRFAELSK